MTNAPQELPQESPFLFEISNTELSTGIKRVVATISKTGDCNLSWSRIKEISTIPIIIFGMEDTQDNRNAVQNSINSQMICKLLLQAFEEGKEFQINQQQVLAEVDVYKQAQTNALASGETEVEPIFAAGLVTHMIITDEDHKVIGHAEYNTPLPQVVGAWKFSGVDIGCLYKPHWLRRWLVRRLLNIRYRDYGEPKSLGIHQKQ